ncbi:hypothetical protein [Absidia glauca]|uniref:Uncharacterized protein n=1 Tax=Absidia glauca TaxID=4829 RepID=A0A168R9D3_ABSGL|nr:hypothetical protein [Absidia glauca]
MSPSPVPYMPCCRRRCGPHDDILPEQERSMESWPSHAWDQNPRPVFGMASSHFSVRPSITQEAARMAPDSSSLRPYPPSDMVVPLECCIRRYLLVPRYS